MHVTIMGLGLHGGGLVSARFFAEHGAKVTVTDLRDYKELEPSIANLRDYKIRYVLGRHEASDFATADLVIKNPAVRPDSEYLLAARTVETDISTFLRLYSGRVVAVTGTKGKSTTAAAIQHVLKKKFPGALLGGNITVSPLSFLLDREEPKGPAVLELSSWQLADIRGKGVLRPNVALVTNIMRDHQNRYASMQEYIQDKLVICENQTENHYLVLNSNDATAKSFSEKSKAKISYFSRTRLPAGTPGGFLKPSGGLYSGPEGTHPILSHSLSLRGEHNRMNLLAAGICCLHLGVPASDVFERTASFQGIEHRLEYVRSLKGVEFYNDSAATIPEATIEAVKSFTEPVVLIAGGTDKELDFGVLRGLKGKTKLTALLEGTGTEHIVQIFKSEGIPYIGPFSSLRKLIACIMERTQSGDIVLLSPGCTSFGMFLNEFDRGVKFKTLIQELA